MITETTNIRNGSVPYAMRHMIRVCAGLFLLAMVGCREVPLPDASVGTQDSRWDWVHQSLESDVQDALRNGCRLRGLTIVCNY